MSQIFIITGMPRSRTAWMANYMTQDGILCEHELLTKFSSPKECAEWMKEEAQRRPAVGMSDSGAVLFHTALRKELPEAKWAVVLRNPADSEHSYLVEHGMEIPLGDHWRRTKALAFGANGPVLPCEFANLDRDMAAIARYCVPTWKHDERRHNMLMTFDIKMTHESLVGGVQRFLSSGLLTHIEKEELWESQEQQ